MKSKIAVVLVILLTALNAMAQDADLTEKQKLSYALGVFFSQNIIQQGLDLDNEMFLQAVDDMLNGNKPKLSQDEIKSVFEKFRTQELAKQNASGTENSESGRKFLAENGKRDGVVTTRSGLQYEIIRKGTGKQPGPDSMVTVHYRGTLIDGREFDSSYRRKEPVSFGLKGVIKGWQEALPLMRAGAKWKLYIPPQLAYGAQSQGIIGPQSTLIFDVELLDTK